MRFSIAFVVTLSLGFISVQVSAQIAGPNPLAGKIREQELAVERLPGKSDGAAWLKLAVLCQGAAQYRDSERAYRRAIALFKSADRATFADAIDHMGTMYVESGHLSKAESLERKALAIRQGQHDTLGIGISRMHMSALLLGKHELHSAEAEGEMAVSLLVPEPADPALSTVATPEEQMTALIDLSLVRCALNDCAAAVPDLRRALGIARKNYSANSLPVGILDFLLGYALWKSGDNRSAAELMRNGTQELETPLGWGHPAYRRALTQYRAFLTQIGNTSEAEQVGARIANLEHWRGSAGEERGHLLMGLEQLH
jgi:tetratricopeptide (TPR) repeat protein